MKEEDFEQPITELERRIEELSDFSSDPSRQKEIDKLRDKLQALQSADLFANPEEIVPGHQFKVSSAPDNSDLRKLSDSFTDRYPEGTLLLTLNQGDKISVLLRTGKKNRNLNCSNVLKNILASLGGRGGGRPDMAQGSCPPSNAESLVNQVKDAVKNELSK